MKHLDARRLEDLEALAEGVGDAKIVLIGAAALDLQLDLEWRQTFDLDLTIALPIEAYPGGIAPLKAWTRDPHNPIRWTSPSGTRVDIIPAGPEQVRAEFVDIPGTTNRMSLVGFRHVFMSMNPFPRTTHPGLGIAPIPVIALLKMVSYQDRPHDRERDLGDLAYILERYPDASDDRRFDDAVFDSGVTSEAAGAFVLGRELGEMLDTRERKTVQALSAILLEETDGGRARSLMLRLGPPTWNGSAEELLERVRALELGLRR